jgi:hypothetical protein
LKPSIPLGIAALLRFVIPGILAFIFSWPLLAPLYKSVGIFSFHTSNNPSSVGADAALIAAISFIYGLIVSLLDDPIYKIYEGLLLWPRSLSKISRSRLDNRVKRLYNFGESIHYTDEERYEAISNKLKSYPLDDNAEPYAIYPTRLGNILYEYEHYSDSRYKLNGIFYFPRLWFIIEEHNQKEFRTIEIYSESPLYISFVAGVIALAYLLVILIKFIGISLGYEKLLSNFVPLSLSKLVLWDLASFATSVLFYYISLPLHVIRGDYFKALYDLYGEKLLEKMSVTKLATSLQNWNESPNWEDKLDYLLYRTLYCDTCKRGFPESFGKCPRCKSDKSHETVHSYKADIIAYKSEVNKEFSELAE